LLAESSRLRERAFIPETEVQARDSAVSMAAAALARAESTLATARERRDRHALLAPFGGVIAVRLVEVGEWVETGTTVAELVDTDELWLDVRAPQRYWNDLDGEATVAAVADAVPGRNLEARVHRRVPVNDTSARTFLVRLVAANDGGEITPGMSARARFEIVGEGEVLRVPRDALIRYPDGTTTVWIVDRRGDRPLAREIEVSIGETVGDQVEVLDGLDQLQAVIVRGNEVLGNGDPVRVVGAGGR
jgi:RND family efflux transporter MFP subunit